MCSGWDWHRKCLCWFHLALKEMCLPLRCTCSESTLGALMHEGHENIMQQKSALSPSFYLNTNDGSRSIFKLIQWRPAARGQMKVGTKCSCSSILPTMLDLSPVQWRGCVALLAIGTEAGNGKQFWHWQPGVLPFSNTFDVHTWSFGCCCWGPSVGMASCLIKWWYASFTGTWNTCQTKRVWFYFYYSEFKAHANTNPHFNTIVVPVKHSFFPSVCQVSTMHLGT